MKANRTTNASISNETRKAVYRRDGYRCALCDDTRGLQIHHYIHRSRGGSDKPQNLICLCWRCHAEAHGTWLPERHAYTAKDPEGKWVQQQLLLDEYEQMICEYLSDYYACEGEDWWPYK